MISAIARDGAFGAINVQRGEDVGGYALVPQPSSASHFFIELFVTYELRRFPEHATWGALDWRLVSKGAPIDAQQLDVFPPPAGRGPLGNWPGATVPEDRYDGWLIFAVAREAAQARLELVYQPSGAALPLASLGVRAPGPAPEPVAAEWPRPDPVYVAREGLPFAVFDSAEADALFADPDNCANPVAGYTVTYPDEWFTNTAIGAVPACSWFSPTVYEATPGGQRPAEIAIEIRVFDGAVGSIWADLYAEDVDLDGFPTRRAETGFTKDPATPTDRFEYSYLARSGGDPLGGRKFWAFTGTEYGGSYELNKAVLDRIMASLKFTD